MYWNWNRLCLFCVVALIACSPGLASIIDDKSDFVGDFTVIDFETRGDGTPLILQEGGFLFVPSDEYLDTGVTMNTTYHPAIAFGTVGQLACALTLAGSPDNVLVDGNPHGYLRFDFDVPVNAVGLSVMNWMDGERVHLAAYNANGQLLEAVDFGNALLDGVILGADFGNPFDIEYGFFGVFAPADEISYAVISEDRTVFDDLHFGVIAEPVTLIALGAGALLLFGAESKRGRPRRARVTVVAFLGICAPEICLASHEIHGRVEAWIMVEQYPICGEAALDWPGGPRLQTWGSR